MTPEETKVYLRQHWDLYLAEENAAAHFRACRRLQKHLVDLACKEAAQNFVDELIADLKKGKRP